MSDRIALIQEIAPRAELSAANGVRVKRKLDEAATLLVIDLPLEEARGLDTDLRADLETVLRQSLTLANLKKVAKKWEPNRRVARGETQTALAQSLTKLLNHEREPYQPCKLDLASARALDSSRKSALSEELETIASIPDLRKVAKKWDPNKPLPSNISRRDLAAHVEGLLGGTVEPAQKKAPALRTAKRAPAKSKT